MLGMELRWLLLLPIYRTAYIGLIANAYSREQRHTNIDYSVYGVSIKCSIYALSLISYWKHSEALWYITYSLILVWAIYSLSLSYTILKLYTKHTLLWALISWLPGVTLYLAVCAERKLSC